MTDSLLNKEVLTTGDVARICHVAPRTVSKWFDTGQLHGYRIPGSRDRRIPADQLRSFMRMHGIPLGELDNGDCRVLMIEAAVPPALLEQLKIEGRLTVRQVANEFVAGMAAQQFRPHVIVLDATGLGDEAADLARSIRQQSELSSASLVALCGDGDPSRLRKLAEQGFNAVVGKPYSAKELLGAIRQVRGG
jgi:CheY-like chemotaxis protein